MATTLETLVVRIAADATDYTRTIDGAKKKLDGFAKGAKDLGGKLSVAVTAPLVAAGGAALVMASDLEETVSKVNTLFGDNAAAIQSWADNSATSFGLSKQAALDAVGTLGNMFLQLGAESNQAAQLSQAMVGLSADIASFHNVAGGSQEVLDAMTSAFRGEYDALQRFIPTINAAAVEHEALAMTGKESAKELTNLEKALATQQIIMRDAGAAAGDFARTSDGLANTQRILQAELANVAADLGKELLPIALEVAKGLRELLGWFSELSPSTKKWILIVAGVAAAAGPVIGAIGAIAGGISALIGAVGAVTPMLTAAGITLSALTGPIALVIGAVAALALAWNTDFLGIRTKTQEFWGWITGQWPGWVESLRSKWQEFTSWFSDTTRNALNTVRGWWEEHKGEVTAIADNQWQTLRSATQIHVDAWQGIIRAGTQFARGDFEGGLNTLKSTAETVWGHIRDIFNRQLDNIRNIFTLFGWEKMGNDIANGIANGLSRGAQWIADAARNAAQRALDAAKSFLGIHSPARVPRQEVGEPTGEGIGLGITDGLEQVTQRIHTGLQSLMRDLEMPNLAPAGAGAGGQQWTIHVQVSGEHATYETGRQVGRGVIDEMRSRGMA